MSQTVSSKTNSDSAARERCPINTSRVWELKRSESQNLNMNSTWIILVYDLPWTLGYLESLFISIIFGWWACFLMNSILVNSIELTVYCLKIKWRLPQVSINNSVSIIERVLSLQRHRPIALLWLLCGCGCWLFTYSTNLYIHRNSIQCVCVSLRHIVEMISLVHICT